MSGHGREAHWGTPITPAVPLSVEGLALDLRPHRRSAEQRRPETARTTGAAALHANDPLFAKTPEHVEQPARPKGCLGKGQQMLQEHCRNVRDRPAFMLLPPLLTFLLLASASVAGVVLGADKFEADTRGRAESAALDWAASFRLSAEKIFTPLVTLSILIQQNPQFPALRAKFPSIAEELLHSVNQERSIIQELQLSPMGVISSIHPKNNNTDSRLGINIFKQPALRGGALDTVVANQIVINGPLKLVQGNFGTIARIPIFISNATANETWGVAAVAPVDCPVSLCFNATTRERFWGFATAVGPLDDLRAGNDTRLDLLKQKGYKWLMTRPYTSSELNDSSLHRPEWTNRRGQFVFANSSAWPSGGAVESNISLGNAVWRAYLEPEDGWRPPWERGLIAAVVLVSGVVAALVGVITASWAQRRRLLSTVMEANVRLADTTAKLQEEKLRLDALLVRQYNLLAVLGSPRRHGSCCGSGGVVKEHSSSDGLVHGTVSQGLTLDRIENMRRQLAVNSNSIAQDLESIQTVDLLGEGTFGKVFKGLWRGTTVAVKTMILPANMSGAEKREKMAVMEAAISSSLSHPNIVQTYTYSIREMVQQDDETTPAGADSTLAATTTTARLVVQKSLESTVSNPAVHSYEVRLVLEFCDKGCLRDALDDGAFLTVGGVNYPAILDTAADVAKALLHLHSLNVLHSDLKARNVMLATAGADGRGVVAKVGDFGLSLKMDALETHVSQVFQGTVTHMAPEILLDGRVSKAADVYAFGMTLWELYTGGSPFQGVPRALLGHQITREHLRPSFPPSAPRAYRQLAERCWHPDWAMRPCFAEVLRELLAMRAVDPRPTPPLRVVPRTRPPPTGIPAGTGASRGNGTGNGSAAAVIGMEAGQGQHNPQQQQQQQQQQRPPDRSYYLDDSLDDSDDAPPPWSPVSSGHSPLGGESATSPAGSGGGGGGEGASAPLSSQHMRSGPLPQIAELGESLEAKETGCGGAGGGGGRRMGGRDGDGECRGWQQP